MNQQQPKNEWEEIKENSKELKSAVGLVLRFAFFGVAMLVGIWSFTELIFQVTLTLVQASLLTIAIGATFLVRSWWSNRQSK